MIDDCLISTSKYAEYHTWQKTYENISRTHTLAHSIDTLQLAHHLGYKMSKISCTSLCTNLRISLTQ